MKENRIKVYVLLHILLMVFSLVAVCSKIAAAKEFLSSEFFLFYGILIVILGIYAICWQQIIKRLPLTTAFANRAVTVIWGMVWGFFIFQEKITVWRIIGSGIIIIGIIMYAGSDEKEDKSR
ncbi:MAG: EamA family transporter [Fibrobacter sp.]|nr:EamA family transporter [Fibrobacter sp.]